MRTCPEMARDYHVGFHNSTYPTQNPKRKETQQRMIVMDIQSSGSIVSPHPNASQQTHARTGVYVPGQRLERRYPG